MTPTLTRRFLTAIKVSDPANGTLVLNADGSFTYTPDADFNGTDTFTYKANDGYDDSNVATVTITVTEIKDQVQAVDDFYTTDEDTTLTVEAPGCWQMISMSTTTSRQPAS